MTKRKQQPLRLLVEGDGDKHIVWHLQNTTNIERGAFEVVVKGSSAELISSIKNELRGSETTAVGILIDADNDPAAKWNAVLNQIRLAGYGELPDEPNSQGVIIHDAYLPRVGIWIMPDNRQTGAIEDFLIGMIVETDPLWQRVVATVDQIPQIERRFRESRLIKAYAYTWLAWQAEPGKPLGQAIEKRYFDPESPLATVFKQWLFADLFELAV